MLRIIGSICAKDVRQRLRDRSILVIGFVAPISIAALMNFAFGGVVGFNFTAAIVDEDGGLAAASVLEIFDDPDLAEVVTVERYDTSDAARQAVIDGDVDAALVIPAGFSDSAQDLGASVDLVVFTSVDADIAGEVLTSIASSITSRFNTGRVVASAALANGVDPATVIELAAAAGGAEPAEIVASVPTGAEPIEPVSYFAPAMGILFVLFSIGFSARSFSSEREAGTLDRIAAAPVPSGVVLAGKSLATFLFSLTSLLVLTTASAFLFGASWGNPIGVVVLCIAMSVSVVALTMIVIALARTERQADGIASMVTFGLAIIGGNFLFVSQAPELLRRLALTTPNGWALRGFTDLSTGVGTVEAVLVPTFAILGFSVVVALVAVAFSRRAVVQ